MALFNVTFDGDTWEYDSDRISMGEAREVFLHTGMNLAQWTAGLRDDNPFAMTALIYLLRKRAGDKAVVFAEIDGDFSTYKIEVAKTPGGGEDPTKPRGKRTSSRRASAAVAVDDPEAASQDD